ncbi:hypothetical protein GF420_15735 [candidate division GN15 bacterium]|nr:hypothetical protein [candidate division GN15 bacterium]
MEQHRINELILQTREKAYSIGDKKEFLSWAKNNIPTGLEGLGAVHDYVKEIHPRALWEIKDWIKFLEGEYEDGWTIKEAPVTPEELNAKKMIFLVREDYDFLNFYISPVEGKRYVDWRFQWVPGMFIECKETYFSFDEEYTWEIMGDKRDLLWEGLQLIDRISEGQLFWDIQNKWHEVHPRDGFLNWFQLVTGETVPCPNHREDHCWHCTSRGFVSKRKAKELNIEKQNR